MRHCKRCSVILEDDALRCPLCGAPAAEGEPELSGSGTAAPPVESEAPGQGEEKDLTASERSRIAVELLSVGFGIALAVCILADLFHARRFSWSLYAVPGIGAAWLGSAMPIILRRHPWVLFAVLAPSLVLLVFLLDILDGSHLWFLGYGLPITLWTEACVAGSGALIAAQRRHGLNVLGVILSAVALLCIGIEGVVDLNLRRALSPSWSVVVAFALVPSAAILFYLHYRIVRRSSLRKLFRL